MLNQDEPAELRTLFTQRARMSSSKTGIIMNVLVTCTAGTCAGGCGPVGDNEGHAGGGGGAAAGVRAHIGRELQGAPQHRLCPPPPTEHLRRPHRRLPVRPPPPPADFEQSADDLGATRCITVRRPRADLQEPMKLCSDVWLVLVS